MFFRDVIGHERVVAELRRGLVEGRLGHGHLFVGRRGVGKSLVARALAAAWLCDAREEGGEACGSCRSCASFAREAHPDGLVLRREEGRRDVGIAQARLLAETIHLKPMIGARRAVLVDDAERLTAEAQNALLKTLEEPPPGTLILLVAARLEALLPTVRSRCQIHRFAPLREEEMERFRERRAPEAKEGGAPLRLADGSPGRWLRLCEPVAGRLRTLALAVADAEGGFDPVRLAAAVREAAHLAEDGAGEVDREEIRRRYLLFVDLLDSVLADLSALAVGVPPERLRHADRADALGPAAVRLDLDAALAARERCPWAAREIHRNVDPFLVVRDLLARAGAALAG